MVLGAGGFIGKKFINMFCDKYDIVSVISDENGKNPDLTDYTTLLSILNKGKPDAVLNLAGKSYHTIQDNAEIYESNLLIQLNLHEAINQLGINPKIVFCSSSAVYDSSLKPVNEDSFCLPKNSYAKAKYIQERIGLSYHSKHYVVIARLFNVIGPFQHKGFFIPSVIDQMIRYKKNEISMVQLKTLNAIRDFIFINDVCSAISTLIDKGVNGEIYNICSGKGITLKEVIELLKEILKISDFPLETEEDYVKEGINYQVGSNQKILELGWSPSYNIRKSLEKIISEEYGS